MIKKKTGIQQFRLLAALMVVAIHCFPFQQLAPDLDIFITLTLFRVAVPFFFMVTGFFILGPLATRNSYSARRKVGNFLKKLLWLYFGANLLFIPLALYNGTLSGKMTLAAFLKLILFEGFLYHLWYFPALITGVVLLSLLLRKWPFSIVGCGTILLYIIGLGGDSWFRLVEELPLIREFYEQLFQLMGGTRNGLFLAPLFLWLGADLYRKKNMISEKPKQKLMILILSLSLLLLESAWLHRFSVPRHDSMYLLLPFVMYPLFQLIYLWQPGHSVSQAADWSLGIYLLHPYVIAVTHFISEKIVLFSNNLFNFILVIILSWISTLLLLALKRASSQQLSHKSLQTLRASKVISQQAISHNLAAIRQYLPEPTKVMAVIKANAYGCDSVYFAKKLEQHEVDFFAVATIDEAIRLRKAGIKSRILIMGYTSPERVPEIVTYSLIQSIISEEHAFALNQQKIKLVCHVKVDTGMHRLGVKPDWQQIKVLYQLPYLDIQGIFSHLGSADQLDPAAVQRTKKQIKTYDQLIAALRAAQVPIGLTHLQSSYGILNYPDLTYDYVRPGLLLYGMLSTDSDQTVLPLDLHPAVTIKAQLIAVKKIPAGEAVGYGSQTVFASDHVVGVVSIGYGDGISRHLSETAFALSYKDYEIPQIGRICMDMLLIDLTWVEPIPIETELTVINNFPQKASNTNTITNELLSQLGSRLSLNIQK